MRRFDPLLRLLVLLLPMMAAPAAAEKPVSVVAARSPNLALADNSALLVSIDNQPIVISKNTKRAYLLKGNVWSALQMSLVDNDRWTAATSDGRRAILLGGRNGLIQTASTLILNDTGLGTRPLPVLPAPLRAATSALHDDKLSVAGMLSNGRLAIFQLDLAKTGTWRATEAWPGGEAPAAIAAQNGGLFVTTNTGHQWRWLARRGWTQGAAPPGMIVTGSARDVGQAYILYLVKGRGGAQLYGYSSITDAWAPLGNPISADVMASASAKDGILVASREGAALALVTMTLKSARLSLGLIDWLIIGGYLFAMLGIGLTFYRRAKQGASAEFFLGSRSIPGWAAGISMFAGSISSISYLAVPAKAFETDWEYIMSKLATVCGLVFVAMVVVPVFRRLNLVSVFNYLETRFHPVIRMMSSALWILMQVGGRMGIVLYLPAMAIGTITDTNITACIVIVGLFTIVYTALGGMRAVVWTDVFQVLVLTCGAFFAIGFVLYRIGLGNVVSTAATFDKTRMFNFSFDITQPTVWAFMILALFDVVLTFPKDQVLMQRVLATPSEKEAKRSVWLFAIVLLPSAFMFYIIGTVLFAYYRARPGQLNPLLPIDAVFPAFISTELPHGVVGVIIAGLIAAAMGTLSGIINSVATLISVDFYQRIVPDRGERQVVRFAEVTSVAVGLVGIAIAIVLSRLDIHSLLDLTIELFGLLGGACAGAYTLGLFTRRANWQGVAIGILSASVLTFVVWWNGLIHPYLYLALAIASSIAVGYLASLLFPPPAHSLEGLTIFSAARRSGNEEPDQSTLAS